MANVERNLRKTRTGIVTSNKMDKTIVVEEHTKVKDAIYKKTVNKTNKYVADDPENICDIGDTVEIAETRPLSKNKRWRLVRIVEKVK